MPASRCRLANARAAARRPPGHLRAGALGRRRERPARPRVLPSRPMPRALPDLAACVDVCRELLAGEPELLADLAAIFGGARPRWDRLPDDLRRGLADIAWDELVARGLAPGAGDRGFIDRRVRRCEACGASERPRWDPCPTCGGTGRECVERRGERPASLAAVLILAGDRAGMLAAEALAREAAARLWPWRGRHRAIPRPTAPPRRVAWRVDERDGPLELMRGTRALCPLLYELLAKLAHDRRRGSTTSSRRPASACPGAGSSPRARAGRAASASARATASSRRSPTRSRRCARCGTSASPSSGSRRTRSCSPAGRDARGGRQTPPPVESITTIPDASRLPGRSSATSVSASAYPLGWSP